VGSPTLGDGMKFHSLARLFYEWGWEIKHEHYVGFSDYVKQMLALKRVLFIREGDEVIAALFYYLTDDYELVYKKSTWDIAQDNPNGHQMYIDKMVCKKFSRELVRVIKSAVENQFPNVKVGIYHRAPKDKCIKIYCGGKNEKRLHSSVR